MCNFALYIRDCYRGDFLIYIEINVTIGNRLLLSCKQHSYGLKVPFFL